ncbi:MAG: hypothetical protein M3O46_11165 [Myxococcota bacterium]|nr:hypothetical protein [Myxococcota bacterium]
MGVVPYVQVVILSLTVLAQVIAVPPDELPLLPPLPLLLPPPLLVLLPLPPLLPPLPLLLPLAPLLLLLPPPLLVLLPLPPLLPPLPLLLAPLPLPPPLLPPPLPLLLPPSSVPLPLSTQYVGAAGPLHATGAKGAKVATRPIEIADALFMKLSSVAAQAHPGELGTLN